VGSGITACLRTGDPIRHTSVTGLGVTALRDRLLSFIAKIAPVPPEPVKAKGGNAGARLRLEGPGSTLNRLRRLPQQFRQRRFWKLDYLGKFGIRPLVDRLTVLAGVVV
jgi:hypothetical protein